MRITLILDIIINYNLIHQTIYVPILRNYIYRIYLNIVSLVGILNSNFFSFIMKGKNNWRRKHGAVYQIKFIIWYEKINNNQKKTLPNKNKLIKIGCAYRFIIKYYYVKWLF